MAGSKVTVDLSGYKEMNSDRVDAGTYTVQVEDVEMQKSNAGNPMIVTWLRVVDGDYAGSVFVDRLTQTQAALFRTVGFLNALGIPTPKKRLQIDLRALVGKTLRVAVDDGEPYRGVVKSEVRSYERAVGRATDEEPDDLPVDEEDDYEEPAVEAEPVEEEAPRTRRRAPEPEADDSDDTDDAPEAEVRPLRRKKREPEPTDDDADEIDLEALDNL